MNNFPSRTYRLEEIERILHQGGLDSLAQANCIDSYYARTFGIPFFPHPLVEETVARLREALSHHIGGADKIEIEVGVRVYPRVQEIKIAFGPLGEEKST